MIVAQSEITLIKLGRRRQMMLPMARGALSELLPCPVGVGELLRLQTRPFEKGTRLTVIAIEVGRVAELSEDQAQHQGYKSAAAVRDAWLRQHSIEDVWILSFARGDHSAFFRDNAELYLKAKGVGLTRDPNKGVRTEPAVTTDEQLQLAARAAERRSEEHFVILNAERKSMRRSLTRLRALEITGDVQDDLQFIERRLSRLERKLGVAA